MVFLRGPLKRIKFICFICFTLTFIAYFYLTRDNNPPETFHDEVIPLKDNFGDPLQFDKIIEPHDVL